MYMRTCGSLKSVNYQKDWVRKSQIRKVPDLRQIRKSANYLRKSANVRICDLRTAHFGVVHKLHIIYTLVNHGILIYKVKRDINNYISNLKCK
jgi:hypothetical protein